VKDAGWFGLLLVLGTSLSTPGVGQTPATAWRAEDEVFYQIFVRSFRDSNGDRVGDLGGIQEKLGYLQGLGVTSVLLTPVNPSPFYHNYFAASFEGVDAAYGGPEALASLITAVHARGMRIYLDEEVQYLTGEHRWWKDSERQPGSAFSHFLLYNGPGNTQPESAVFGITEGQMYNGTRVRLASVNLLDAGVQAYFQDLFAAWVDPNHDGRYDDGVDGFRLDHMMDDLDLKKKLPDLFARFWAPIFKRARATNPQVKFIAEQYDWRYGEEFLSRGGVDMVFAFPLRGAIASLKARAIGDAIAQTAAHTPPGKGQLLFIENHDMNRFASEVNGDLRKEKAGAALNILLKGTPLIYYGQEIGMTGRQSKEWGTDGNDIPVREAFEWTRRSGGPGSATWYRETGPWWTGRYARDDDGISVEEEVGEPHSLLAYYRQLIGLRHSRAELREGDEQVFALSLADVLAVVRERSGQASLLLVNLADETLCVPLPRLRLPATLRSAALRDLLDGGAGARIVPGACVELRPFGVSLLAR
jgi:alpha-amylase